MAAYLGEVVGFPSRMVESRDSFFVVDGDMEVEKAEMIEFLRENPDLGALVSLDPNARGAAVQAAARLARQRVYSLGVVKHEDVDGFGAATGGIPVFVTPSVPSTWRRATEDAVNYWNASSTSKVRLQIVTSIPAFPTPTIVVNKRSASSFNANVAATGAMPVNGRPGNVFLNVDGTSLSRGALAYVLTHEFGHTLGFRHTDARNESDYRHTSVPRTPVTDPRSFMNATVSPSYTLSTRGFTTEDKHAARVIYPVSLAAPSILGVVKSPGYQPGAFDVRLRFLTDDNTAQVAVTYRIGSGAWQEYPVSFRSDYPSESSPEFIMYDQSFPVGTTVTYRLQAISYLSNQQPMNEVYLGPFSSTSTLTF
ncbi:M57 family metalloprotease [Rubrivirga sp.]|uniref:M57 family metalloprotease n=1 Tax=Rubrivirga sp. TaxID=1885344 RepID=UPI003C78EE5D